MDTMAGDPRTALRGCWHPVAYAADVAAAPRATTLLEEPLVLWRERNGTLRAFRPVCIHRLFSWDRITPSA
jgi:phenylpropionate dioxygenase-like ring-hydroxylating dioxygenase large terminal subunit